MPFSIQKCSDLSDCLSHISTWVQKEFLSKIPQGEPKAFLYDLLPDYPSRGGKNFRSALVFLSCELLNGDAEQCLETALAYEAFHNFALIHDDIEDASLIRRGKPALHLDCGIPLAINAGDRMFSLSYDFLRENFPKMSAGKALALFDLFSKSVNYTFEGQALDIGWSNQKGIPGTKDYLSMAERKTGWYSGKGPCQSGAIIGDGDEEQRASLGKMGMDLAIAFQIRDDILNLIEESSSQAPRASGGGYGKERGGDIAEGKRTLISMKLFEVLEGCEQEKFLEILEKSRQETTEEDIAWGIQKAEESGAIDYAIDHCEGYALNAKNILSAFSDSKAKQFLNQMIEYLALERKA